jgi:PAS domain S-box-containing protein
MAKKNSTFDSTAPKTHDIPIAAIGASAGGQEAVVELLRNLSPTTGLAYVYIQHLDPTQESHLTDILGRATTMPVVEAQHLMRIEPNHLYIIPPDRDLEVLDGMLTLVPRKVRSAIHMPIDQFFLSLAQRQKEGAIAVVLSGTASDGTLGLRAIKAAGGITIAQDDTARFQSMPRSAIAEGVVDQVLPPAEIARELERLSTQVSVFKQTILTEAQEAESIEALMAEPSAGANEDLRSIIQLLRRATGVDFSHYKVTTIRRRIIRRTLLYKLDSLRDYANYLRQHPEEASLLYDDLLINVTTFFRDVDTMDYLQKVLLPQLVREKTPQEPLRIWVPACSTGQEAYSIAMLLLEVLGDRALSRTIQLFATDLSESAVAKARLGIYTRGEVMDVSPRRLQRFFTKVDDHYRINKSVRDLCVFAPHNLLKDPPFSRLDLISCRNLLIYLDTSLQRKAIVTFHYALNPIGYLVLGKSETVGTSAPLFSQIEKNYKVFARKNDIDSRASFTMTPRQLDGDQSLSRPTIAARKLSIQNLPIERSPSSGPERWAGTTTDLDKTVDNLLLSQYVPASVLVNQDLEILQFRGSTGLFLEPSPGKASLNLIKMARPALVFELRNAVHKAQKSGESVRKSGLEIKVKGKTHYVSIEAVPIDTPTEERLFLIVFEEVDPPVVPVIPSIGARNKRIKELESELANLREDMRSIIEEQEASNEELQSANEEIISSNEELQSINEELETSKEEIESTNEELLTINQELQVRNDQLSEANQFADDIFGTIREATLVLDTDLRVKSANQAFYRLFQLSEGATERRLIYELGNRQWDIPELRLMLTDIVNSDVQFQGFELTYVSPEVGEKNLSLNARRVVRHQDSILLAIEDITEHRRAQQLLAEREAWFHRIADNVPSLIWVTDAGGNFIFLNKVWLQYTGRTVEEVRKHGIAESVHPDDRAEYLSTFKTHVEARQGFNAEYRLRRQDGNYRWMLENAQPVVGADGLFSGYIGSSADVHLQKELNQELDRRVQERTRELEENRDLLKSMFENTPDVITRWDTDLRLVFANSAFVEKTGMSIDALLGKTNLGMGQPESIALPYMDKLRLTFDTGQPQEHYNGFPTPDGLVQYFSRMVPEFGPDGSIVSVLAIARDITQLQEAELETRQERRRLAEAQAIGHVGSFEWNAGDEVTHWSDELYRISGLVPQSETITVALTDQFTHPDDMAVYQSLKQQSMEKPGRYSLVHRIIRRDGSLRWVQQQFESIANEQGEIIRVIGTIQDMTEQRRAAEQLQQTAQNLQAVLNSSPAAIGYLKPVWENEYIIDFRLAVCNQEFAQIATLPVEQLTGLLASQLANELWGAHTVENIRRVLETGEIFQQELYNPANTEWRLITLMKYDGGVVLTGQKITALKKAEEQQSRLLEELEKSDENIHVLEHLRQHIQSRGELLRSTSHDLRSNFGIIQGAATLLDMANTDEERSQMLEMLQRNLRQATQMLTELLDFARLEAGQEQRQISPFDATQLLTELVESVRPLADQRGLWLRIEGSESMPVESDGVKVRRIAQNLLLNALKYTQTGGVTVNWGAASTDDYWQFSITDTGPGLKRLGSADEAPAHAGEGIGLSIVRQLCELLDGEVEIESKAEVGTRLRVLLPRRYD